MLDVVVAGLIASAGTAAVSLDVYVPPEDDRPAATVASQPMQGEALRTLLRDVYVTPVQPPGVIVDHPPGEMFGHDGSYRRIMGRTSVQGIFVIEGPIVCVEGVDFERLCRTDLRSR